MWDDLFLTPFLSGLCLAVLLPVLGVYLRLRDEWLAGLAYAHVGAAGALLGMLAGLPPAAGGLALSAAAGLAKPMLVRRRPGGVYPLALLLAWGGAVLVTANHPLAERLGHALFDGQLYFSTAAQGLALLGWSVPALLLLRAFHAPLLLSRLYPDVFRLRGTPGWPVQAGFDGLAAISVALGTMTLGVMAGFALVFVPAWLAFRQATSWRRNVALAISVGVTAYVAAFALALWLDQPFGPVLGVLLAVLGLLWPARA